MMVDRLIIVNLLEGVVQWAGFRFYGDHVYWPADVSVLTFTLLLYKLCMFPASKRGPVIHIIEDVSVLCRLLFWWIYAILKEE